MEEILKNGSLLAAVTALSFLIVGLLQWVVSLTKTNDKRRADMFQQIEDAKLENARLRGQVIIYSDKLEDMQSRLQDYKRRYYHYKELYEAIKDRDDNDDDNNTVGTKPPVNN